MFDWSHIPIDRSDVWDHLVEDTLRAGEVQLLVNAVKHLDYLARRTRASGSLKAENDLANAEKHAPDDSVLHLLHRQFANIMHVVNRCRTYPEIADTLYVRLQHLPELTDICRAFKASLKWPHFEVWHPLPDLTDIQPDPERHPIYYDIAVSEDGRRVVTLSLDNEMKIWDSESGKILLVVQVGDDIPYSHELSMSADGRLVSLNGEMRDSVTGIPNRGAARWSEMNVLVKNRIRRGIVSGYEDGTLKVRHGRSGIIATFHADGPLKKCIWHPDGQYLFAVGSRGVYWLQVVDGSTE